MSCNNLSSSHPFTHEVYLDNEPIKRFRSLREAKWFTTNKDNATIVKLAIETPKSVYETFEEAPF
jgi:hypothetical protein